MLGKGEPLPVDFTNRVIYYVGPVDPVRDEVVGPAGPTTATRMDKFTDMMLEQTGLHRDGRQGRARPGRRSRRSASTRPAYLMAVGGAAYLVSKAIKASRVVAFADLGMEAIYEFDGQGHAGDRRGRRARRRRCIDTAPAEWSRADPHARHPGARGLSSDVATIDTLRRFVFERYPVPRASSCTSGPRGRR